MSLNIIVGVFCLIFVLKVNGKVTDEEYALMPEHFQLDNYDTCMLLGENALYCSVKIQLAPVRTNYSKVWKIIQTVNSGEKNYRHDWLRHGVCVPRSCPKLARNITSYKNNTDLLKTALSDCYTEKYEDLRLQASVIELNCETNKPRYSLDVYDIVVALFLAALVLTVALATCYEGLARYKPKEEYNRITKTTLGKIISSFSIVKNWKRLRNTSSSNSDTDSLKCITGIRFYNILPVITAHSGCMKFAGTVSNPWFSEQMTENLLAMVVLNGGFVIQTFLLTSGWLMSYHFFLLFEKRKQVRLDYMVMAFVNRYIRLTPCYLVVVAISGTWMYHLGNGPLWDRMAGEEYRNCRTNWWTNLLYINNYYDQNHMCLLHSWYLATDTQLFLLSLIILTIMWKFKAFIKAIIGVCLIVGIIIPGILTYINGYDILVRSYAETAYNLLLDRPEFTDMYMSGHTNIGGYMIGFMFGYIFYKYREKKVKIGKHHVALWWILTWVLPVGSVLMAYPMYQNNFVYSRLGAAVYVALARNLYALGMGACILGLTRGIGWFFRDCVMWSPLQVLGRLTYCVYLVHYPLIRARIGSTRSSFYLSPYEFVRDILSDTVIAYMVALLLCLFVEMPTSSLQKLMVPQLSKKSQETQNIEPATEVSKVTVIAAHNQVSKI